MFGLHRGKKYCLGSGVALQAPIPLYHIDQQKCFWIPRMGVFEMHNAKKYCLGSGVAPQTPIPLYPIGQQRCFGIPGMGVFEMRNAKKCGVLVWRSKRAYLCTKSARKSVFGYLVRKCLKCAMPKNVDFWRGAPSAHTSAPNLPAKAFLDT